MIRVYVSAEGATEMEFCSKVLAPYLLPRDLSVTAVDMRGNVSMERACSEIRRLVRNCDIITTFYDLYGFKYRNNRTKEELENTLKNEINEPYKFIPYIQQYEFEALLFSDPNITSRELGSTEISSKLSKIVSQFGEVEKINDVRETSPSRRLKEFFPSFNKKLHGPVICEKIGIDHIRKKCHGFNKWIIEIEKLVQIKSRS